jgi:hypothetical protein
MIALGVVKAIDPFPSPGSRKVWRITVNQFVTLKRRRRQNICSVGFYEGGHCREILPPKTDDLRITIDPYVLRRGSLVAEYGTAAQMGFDIR